MTDQESVCVCVCVCVCACVRGGTLGRGEELTVFITVK